MGEDATGVLAMGELPAAAGGGGGGSVSNLTLLGVGQFTSVFILAGTIMKLFLENYGAG